jgi:hypothetical protein
VVDGRTRGEKEWLLTDKIKGAAFPFLLQHAKQVIRCLNRRKRSMSLEISVTDCMGAGKPAVIVYFETMVLTMVPTSAFVEVFSESSSKGAGAPPCLCMIYPLLRLIDLTNLKCLH